MHVCTEVIAVMLQQLSLWRRGEKWVHFQYSWIQCLSGWPKVHVCSYAPTVKLMEKGVKMGSVHFQHSWIQC